MVANIRCAEIAAEQLKALQQDQAWLSLSQQASSGSVPGFGAQAGALISSSLTGAPPPRSCPASADDPAAAKGVRSKGVSSASAKDLKNNSSAATFGSMYCTKYYGLPAELAVDSRGGCPRPLIETLGGRQVVDCSHAWGGEKWVWTPSWLLSENACAGPGTTCCLSFFCHLPTCCACWLRSSPRPLSGLKSECHFGD